MESTTEIKYIFWIGTSIMLMLAFLLLLVVIISQRRLVKIKEKEAELLLKATLESEQRERKRIAADLHDSVQGDLSALKNFISFLIRKNDCSAKDQELLVNIQQVAVQAYDNTKLISNKLMPPLLEKAGLVSAVADHFETLTKNTGKVFTVESNQDYISLSPLIAYELFRIIQEFTQNMIKHGSITHCEIRFKMLENQLDIELEDDGILFDFEQLRQESKGMGLRNIQSRLSSIGADLGQEKESSTNKFTIHLNTAG